MRCDTAEVPHLDGVSVPKVGELAMGVVPCKGSISPISRGQFRQFQGVNFANFKGSILPIWEFHLFIIFLFRAQNLKYLCFVFVTLVTR